MTVSDQEPGQQLHYRASWVSGCQELGKEMKQAIKELEMPSKQKGVLAFCHKFNLNK